MNVEDLRRLRDQINSAIVYDESGLRYFELTEHEKMVHRIMYGEDAVCIGDYVIKPRFNKSHDPH